MSLIVRAAAAEEFGFIHARAGVRLSSDVRGIVAACPRRGIQGMLAFDTWTPNAVQVHIALESPIAFRRLLRPLFEYAFLQAGKSLVWSWIVATNTKSRRLARHVGFVETHKLKDGWDAGVDLVCVEMRRDACRWLKQEKRAA